MEQNDGSEGGPAAERMIENKIRILESPSLQRRLGLLLMLLNFML